MGGQRLNMLRRASVWDEISKMVDLEDASHSTGV